jgi:phage antirepressor YoqD-like protein
LINVQQPRKQKQTRQIELQNQASRQKQMVKAYKRLAASKGTVTIQEAAKALKMTPTELPD